MNSTDNTKLINSNCISLLNRDNRKKFQGAISPTTYQESFKKSSEYKEKYENSLNSDNSIIGFIDDEKSNIKDKMYMEYMIFYGICCSQGLPFLQKTIIRVNSLETFQKIVGLIILETGLTMKDGETMSNFTKRMYIANEDDVPYSRRIDLLFTGNGENLELCSIEFKKCGVNDSVIKKQHNKKLKNQCLHSQCYKSSCWWPISRHNIP
ncbi:unnamed protein product [Rhizopus stolonifer]